MRKQAVVFLSRALFICPVVRFVAKSIVLCAMAEATAREAEDIYA